MTQALKSKVRTDGYCPSPDVPPPPLTAPADKPHSRMWRWWGALFLALAAVAGWFGMSAQQNVPAPAALPVVRTSITALGWLEPASDVIKLAPPATVESSRISRLTVEEGDTVVAGQVIAELDTTDKLRAQVKLSEAQVALKRATLERVRLDTDNTAVSRRMAVARAKADLDQAETEFARQKALTGREYASVANLEKRKRDLEVAKAQLEENKAASKRMDATLSAPGEKPVQIDIAVAERELASSEADLVQYQVSLDQASIKSPIEGRILSVLSRPGEKVSQDGVVEIGSTGKMVAIAEVYQSDISLVKVGQPVELKSDTLTTPVIGHVERVGLKVKRQSVINNDPATDTDARVIEVRIALDPASSSAVASLTSLQVRAYFKLEQL
jgi:HlyD family secretion protein